VIGCYLGVDVGSVSTNVVIMGEDQGVLAKVYVKTQGRPIEAVQRGLLEARKMLQAEPQILGVGTTGSGRHLAAKILGADIIKNEITAHGIAALSCVPEVRTIFEIGGQDSKIIFLRDGIIQDFSMNTVCAAGTGSFLDRQAARLGIEIGEFGRLALKGRSGVRIAGRCAVFAESDMIHKQQLGHNQEDLIKGLCDALVRNFLNNLAKGKEVSGPVVFQGGVAANIGIKRSFEEALGQEMIIPEHHGVMGAIGCCLLAKEQAHRDKGMKTAFKGFNLVEATYQVTGFECHDCTNGCEVIDIQAEGTSIARWGDKCGKWGNIKEKTMESA